MSSPSPPRVLVYGSVNCDEFFVVDQYVSLSHQVDHRKASNLLLLNSIVRTGETISSTSYSRRAGKCIAAAAGVPSLR